MGESVAQSANKYRGTSLLSFWVVGVYESIIVICMKIVGVYTEKFNELTGQQIVCGNIYQSDGLYKHIQKRHPDCLDDIDSIPLIISCPDYIGHNPREPESVELVKRLEANLMVCVKLDIKENYLYVASLFEISEAKIESRLQSGRLTKF